MDQHSIARQAAEEHEKLDREIDLLKLRVFSEPSGSVNDWFDHCREHFRHFHTQLRRHMEVEEYGGFMKQVCERRPTLSSDVQALQQQHYEMLRQCVAIESFLCGCGEPGHKSVSRVREEIGALLQDLDLHETAENKLVQQVFVQELGAGD